MWGDCVCLGRVVGVLGCGVRVCAGGVVVGSQGEGGRRRSIPDRGGVRVCRRIGERVFVVRGSDWLVKVWVSVCVCSFILCVVMCMYSFSCVVFCVYIQIVFVSCVVLVIVMLSGSRMVLSMSCNWVNE